MCVISITRILLCEVCYCNLTPIGTSQGRWRFHSMSHSFCTLNSGSTLHHVRAECGLWEDDRNAEVTTLIHDASLHSIVHCAPSWQPHCEDSVKIKDYFPTCKSQVQACPCFSVSRGFQPPEISHLLNYSWMMTTLFYVVSYVTVYCFSFSNQNPFVWFVTALTRFHHRVLNFTA